MPLSDTLALYQNTAPAIEPITLAEAKDFLRLDSGSLDDNITVHQSIAPDEYSAGAQVGSGADISNSTVLVVLNAGTVEATGTLDVKVQESDDGVTYTDVSGGTFTQVTPANDNAIYQYEYTGSLQYIRAHGTVANANAVYSVNITEASPTADDDSLITTLITVARQNIESIANISIINQTWEYYLNSFPNRTTSQLKYGHGANYDRSLAGRSTYKSIWLPMPPLSSVTSIKYTESGDDTDYSNTFSSSNYSVVTKRRPGCIVLKDGETWPSTSLETNDPVQIIYVAGYGATRSSVPDALKHVIKILVGELYENRQDTVFSMKVDSTGILQRILAPYKNWWPL